MKLTPRDRDILSLLTKDARMSITGIAREVSASRMTVKERIEMMCECGVIGGFTIVNGAADDGLEAPGEEIFFFAAVDERSRSKVWNRIRRSAHVVGVWALSDTSEFLVLARASTRLELEDTYEQIACIEGVVSIKARTVLRRHLVPGR
ncbi:Lrp/AsnC family transcriptional regulator [Salinarimonas sp. NSM]|uniref:Lrp/AsnC family transcriptional regulator n=1 Tax=Salinarimonas sp. NSM TaxID=3458003 RepID=UPI0040352EC0